MFMQVIDIFDHPIFQGARNAKKIEDGKMLHILAQSDAAGVRAHRNAILRSHQNNRQILIHARHPAAIDLADINRSGLQQLLEHDAVVAVLAGRNAGWRDGAPYTRVPKDIVRTRSSSIHHGCSSAS